jgi:predicted dinucleotide-binding enzyme
MRLAIIGAGNVGGTLGTTWAQKAGMQLAQLLSARLPTARPSSDLRQRWFKREQHHFAQVLLAAQEHDDAVDAGRSGFTPA